MKPKVAVFDFASCEGCELQIMNLEEKVIDLIDIVDVVSFREAMKENSNDYDIAFIDGCIVRPLDEKRLKEIRNCANILVAMGSCACFTGINGLRKQFTDEDVKRTVYGNAIIENNPYFDVFQPKAIDEVVKVDHYIYGCPIDRNELAEVITSLVMGKKPDIPNYPVCVECKQKENICVFDYGNFCIGPVTRAGCGAICPTNNCGCEGCRGLVNDPDTESELEVLQRYGLSLDDALDRFEMFCYQKGVVK